MPFAPFDYKITQILNLLKLPPEIKEHLTNTNTLNNLSSSQCHPEPCPELVSWIVSGSGLEILNLLQNDNLKMGGGVFLPPLMEVILQHT
jgi:hypothetical protein